MRFYRASHSLPKFPNSQVAVACVPQNVHAFFGLQTTPVSLCGRLKYLFFDNPISVIGRTGIASCSPNKTFKSGRRVYAVRTHMVSAFQRTLLYRVQSPLRLRQSWQSAVVRQLYRLGSLERTNGSIGMRISRSDCKTSVMMKRLDCTTT